MRVHKVLVLTGVGLFVAAFASAAMAGPGETVSMAQGSFGAMVPGLGGGAGLDQGPQPTATKTSTATATPEDGETPGTNPTATQPGATSTVPGPTSTSAPSPTSTSTATPTATTPPPTPTEPTPPPGTSTTMLAGCPVFPADNPWNQDVSQLPVHENSDDYIAFMLQGNDNLHPDFGGDGEYGIPFVVVPQNQPLVPIDYIWWPEQSDPGPFPIPLDAPVEGGGDRHVIALRQGYCDLFELYAAEQVGDGWEAGSGAEWDLTINDSRPAGWTSADAAGLPILPGLVRYGEVAAGEVTHAIRFTSWRTTHGYIYPASHEAGTSNDPDAPPMGLRLRLKAGYDISGLSGQSLVIAVALKKYGMILADNGSSFYITGASDPGWDDEDLNQLKDIPGDAFEVVYTGDVVGD